MRYFLLVVALAVLGWGTAGEVRADGVCISRDDAINVIAHKTYAAGIPWLKWRIWAIADRESGLTMCDVVGRIKVSQTNDHSLLQFHPGGVWQDCAINPRCGRPDLIDDPGYQIDVMIAYYQRYGDFCPWNPDQTANYNPGCGYR